MPVNRGIRVDSIETRAKIITAAEKLFSEKAIEEVTLTMIHEAADQRNDSAINYHFGDKDGVIKAILQKHDPGIERRMNEILDSVKRTRKIKWRDSVKSIVIPFAEKLNDQNGGVAYIRIMDQLVRYQGLLALYRWPDDIINRDSILFRLAQKEHHMPGGQQVWLLKVMLWFNLIIHGLANYSILREFPQYNSDLPSLEEYSNFLIDVMIPIMESKFPHEKA